MKIEILGPGCAKCKKLTANTEEVVDSLKLDAEVVKIEDLKKITQYGVVVTPALVVDGEVKSAGKVLSVEDIKKIIA